MMSKRRFSMHLSAIVVLLIAITRPTTAPIKRLMPESGALEAAAQISPQAKTVNRNQEELGYKLPPEKYARAVAYNRGQYWLYFITLTYMLLVVGAIIRWQVAPRLRDWANGKSTRPLVQFLLYAPTLLVVFVFLVLPTDISAQWHEHKYGFSMQTWPSWLADWTVGEISTVLVGTMTIGLVYWIMRCSPRLWWLFLWIIAVPLIMLVAFFQPVLIDPLFNTLEPLDRSHPELVDSIEKIVTRAGLVIPREHIYLLKVNDKLAEGWATSEGFGPTKCIFVSDTIIASEPGAAILPQIAHEIGHYMLALDWIEFAIAVLVSLAILYYIDRLLVWTVGRWGSEWNIRRPYGLASLPVLALIVAVIVVVFTPVINGISRYREHEADRCGLELVHRIVPNAGETAAQAFQKNAEIGLADPDPPEFIRWWLFDHPPANERIIFFRTYNPWSPGNHPRYVKSTTDTH